MSIVCKWFQCKGWTQFWDFNIFQSNYIVNLYLPKAVSFCFYLKIHWLLTFEGRKMTSPHRNLCLPTCHTNVDASIMTTMLLWYHSKNTHYLPSLQDTTTNKWSGIKVFHCHCHEIGLTFRFHDVSWSCKTNHHHFSTFMQKNTKTKMLPHCFETVMIGHHRWFTCHQSH